MFSDVYNLSLTAVIVPFSEFMLFLAFNKYNKILYKKYSKIIILNMYISTIQMCVSLSFRIFDDTYFLLQKKKMIVLLLRGAEKTYMNIVILAILYEFAMSKFKKVE